MGAVSGLVAGFAMGAILHFGANLVEPLCGLVQFTHAGPHPTLGIAWIAHLALSVGFGIGFAKIVSIRSVWEGLGEISDFLVAGVVYGAFLGIVAAGLIFPVAMQASGVAGFSVPFLGLAGSINVFFAALIFAVGYLVYGLILAAAFATFADVPILSPKGRFVPVE